jgi:hypothetical protein
VSDATVSDDLVTIEKEIIEKERTAPVVPETNQEQTKREFDESVQTLNSLTLEEIKKKGISLPNWRRTNGSA